MNSHSFPNLSEGCSVSPALEWLARNTFILKQYVNYVSSNTNSNFLCDFFEITTPLVLVDMRVLDDITVSGVILISDTVLTHLFAVITLWDIFSVSFFLSHRELCQKLLRWMHHINQCRLHTTFGLLANLKDILLVFFFPTHLWSLWKESFDGRKRIPKSTSHGSFGVNAMYSRHSYTPSLSRSPQHFHRPGERRAKKWSVFFRATVSCFTKFSCLLDLLPVDHEQGWCSLLLYPLKTKTPVPLPLSVTLSSLTNKVRALMLLTLLSSAAFSPPFLSTNFDPLTVLMVAPLFSLNRLKI